MTVRDWLQLLVVPLALVGIGLWFTAQQNARLVAIESRRAEAERELEEQRAQDEALQAYLDQMGTLLLEKDLRNSAENSEVRTLAQERTQAVLERLEDPPARDGIAVQFLSEASLIMKDEPIIDLTHASLEYARFTGGANLRYADLSQVDMRYASLHKADLSNATLHRAVLWKTTLVLANLSCADLSEALLNNVQLNGANLSDADLTNADLNGAFLANADLTNPMCGFFR